MARFPNHAELQSRGCGAIYAMALSNKDTQAALCDADAPAAVLRAMRNFMADPSVAISAADAVMSLACDYRRGQDLLGAVPEGEDGEKGACELLADLVERCAYHLVFCFCFGFCFLFCFCFGFCFFNNGDMYVRFTYIDLNMIY